MRTRSIVSFSVLALIVAMVWSPAPVGADATPPVPLNPEELEAFDGWVYFSGVSDATGRELWRSDGVVTELVVDLWPGTTGSLPASLEAMGGWLYFQARTQATGSELWRTDGTTTELVADLYPGAESSYPYPTEAMDGWVYLSADTEGAGNELWRTNGSITEMVADIKPGPLSSDPHGLERLGGWIFFAARGLGAHIELWRTNGSDVTELVADINPDGPSEPQFLTAHRGWVYFNAFNQVYGSELWRSNGVTTELVADIWPGRGDTIWQSYPQSLTSMGDWLYFDAQAPDRAGMWRTDGATTEFYSEQGPSSAMAVVEGWLYFASSSSSYGEELWRTNGSDVTERISDINPGPANSYIFEIEEMNGWAYFGADTPGIGGELWRSNGATERVGMDVLFSGAVDASRQWGPKWTRALFTPVVGGEYRFELHWGSDADLRISVREYDSGVWIGDNVGSDQPKELVVDLTSGVRYKVAVWAKTGGAEFTTLMERVPPGQPIFDGVVDAERVLGRKWVRTFFTPAVTGDHTFVLDWVGDGNLAVSVKVRSTGAWVGGATGNAHPKSLTVALEAGVTYKIAVWAKTGSGEFTVLGYAPG